MRPQAVDDAEATTRRAIADRLPALGLADLRVVLRRPNTRKEAEELRTH